MVLGGPLGFSQFVMAVCFARVYFHCHYLFDVLSGMFVGIMVATIMVKIGTKDLLKEFFFRYLQSLILGSSSGDGGEFGDGIYEDM